MAKLEPLGLAAALDRWALRREKVLALLDVRAVREARDLAGACRDLHDWPRRSAVTELEFACVWLELRERVVHLLRRCAGARPTRGQPSGPRPLFVGRARVRSVTPSKRAAS